MKEILTQFAAAEAHAEKADLFGSLGIDWKMLVLQTIAFLILLAILRKFVYPPLLAMLDKREKDMRAAENAAKLARDNADKAEKMTNELMRKARAEANEIVKAARDEASKVVDEAAEKANLKADSIIKSAHDEIAKEVETAKKELHNSTIDLIADATGRVLGQKIDAKSDAKLIADSVKEAKL